MMRLFSVSMAALLLLAGCTEVDDRLGASLLPGNQKMNVTVFSVDDAVGTFLYRADSIPSSRTGYAYLGRMSDPTYGARTMGAVLQFVPATRPYNNAEGYGLRPIVDSMEILLEVADARGDSLLTQTYEVYEMRTDAKLHRDSVYHANFPVGDFRGEKLFEFTKRGKAPGAARLFPTAAGREFMQRIVELPWDDYINDTLFFKKFHGLYVTPAEGSPRDAAVLKSTLASSGLRLHVRNHDTLDVNAIYDTLHTLFSFADKDVTDQTTGAVTGWNNVSIGISSFDYAGSRLGELETRTNGFTDTLPTSTPLDEVYVQSMGGVGTFLRFTDSFVERIKALGGGLRDVAINQALMRIYLPDASVPAMDASVDRVGSYADYRWMRPVPDYQYASEASGYTIYYDGWLNRSNGYYELNLTSYVQRLAAGKSRPVIYLGPAAYNVFGFGDSALRGSAGNQPPTIRITYTTIER